jgi:hypothetical protein
MSVSYSITTWILTRSAVVSEIKEVLPVQELTAIYKCSDGREWYLTFSSESLVDEYGDRTVTGASSEVHCERIDKRRVRFRIHWYPFHMKCEPAQDYMAELGSQVVMEYDTDFRVCLSSRVSRDAEYYDVLQTAKEYFTDERKDTSNI